MAADFGPDDALVKVEGFAQLAEKLREIPQVLRRRVLRNALAAGARLVRDESRRAAPRLARPLPYRTIGLLRKSIVVRTSKLARRAGDVGVFVNVRPAKPGVRGAKSPRDPYYWRWVEFGTSQSRGVGFLRAGAARLGAAMPTIEQAVARWISKTSATGRVEP